MSPTPKVAVIHYSATTGHVPVATAEDIRSNTPVAPFILDLFAAVDARDADKVGDFFTGVTEGLSKFLTRLLGASNEKYVRKLGYIRPARGATTHTVIAGSLLEQINSHEEQMRALSDDDLKALTPAFRRRLKEGTPLDDLPPAGGHDNLVTPRSAAE